MDYYLFEELGQHIHCLTLLRGCTSMEAAYAEVRGADMIPADKRKPLRAAILAVSATHPIDLDLLAREREEARERAELARLRAKYGEDTPQGAAVYLDPQGLL